MNKKMIVVSCLIVCMLLVLPSTVAVQGKMGLNGISKLPDFKEFQNMNAELMIESVIELTEGFPEIQDEIISHTADIDGEEVFQKELEELADSNESILEKIWLRVFNYRFFRLYVSFWILLYAQSKISLMRTIHWAIETLEWIQVGIILGIVDIPEYTPPVTPDISFTMDLENSTLSVDYVSSDNVLWSDIDQIGSGVCDPLPTGNVTFEDEITNCTGLLVLRYIPANEVIGVFEFD
jgi:hypothetical protein